ncbi:MAG: hypothetical protein H6670_01010 [Anaerolineaceae bacterium]|nr:hypothetical protein [Anaerolineaceae bacterium]
MQKSKRKQKFRVRTLAETGFIVLAILGVGLFFFIVCVWVVVNLLGGHQQIELQGFEAQTRAEEILGLVLPDDASSFYFDYSRFVDWNTHIRFEIPPTNDTASLIEGICSEQAVRDVSREDLLPEDDLQWWHPDAAVDYLAASCPVSQMAFFSYFILIDQSNSEAWTVYITADSSRD